MRAAWQGASTERRGGFTMIELLMVVLIIGILAMIAIPKFTDSKKRAYLTAMRSDLKNMAGSAEAYYSENRTYIGFAIPGGSAGVTLTMSATATGWSGNATHVGTGTTCDIQVGSAVVASNPEGAPYCTE